MPPQSNKNDSIWNTFGFLTKVRYGGVLGKVVAFAIVVILLLCIIALVGQRFEAVLWGVLIIAFLVFLVVMAMIRSIFLSNPEMATLEGTEVIRYRQNELAGKNQTMIHTTTVISDIDLALPTPPLKADALKEET